jgi:hypothetical protein
MLLPPLTEERLLLITLNLPTTKPPKREKLFACSTTTLCEPVRTSSFPPRGAWWRATLQGLGASLTGTRHPLTDGPLADPHGFGDLALGPACLLEVPGLQTSCFFPSMACRVHAWQCITDRL